MPPGMVLTIGEAAPVPCQLPPASVQSDSVKSSHVPLSVTAGPHRRRPTANVADACLAFHVDYSAFAGMLVYANTAPGLRSERLGWLASLC